ncbi:MAG: hypothetical protein ACTMIR_00295, partial [Cellulomonadaceae bacterium]
GVLEEGSIVSLVDDPYAYRLTASGLVLVSRGGRLVATVGGARADRLAALLGQDDARDQELLARATGHYKHGTERR